MIANNKNYLIFAFIFCAFIYLFFPIIVGNYNFFNEDNSDVFYPCKETIRLALKNGEFPLWTKLRFGGHSFIEEPQAQLFYPFTWIFIKFPTHLEIDYSTILHILFGFLFMYRLLKKLYLPKESAAFGAALFIFSGFFAQAYKDANYGTISTSIWLPLVITELLLFFRTKNKKYFITAILSNVLMFFAGHLNFFYIAQFAIALFILSYNLKLNIKFILRRILIFSIFYICFAICVSPLLLAGFNMARNSARVNRGAINYTTNLSVSPDQLLMFFLENPFGYDDKTFFGPNTTMWQGYTGALALILIFICGFFKRKIKIKFSLILMILVSLFMAFGKYNPLFIIPYKFIPGVSYFRAPQRYLLIYIFAVSIFSAYSINFILKNKFEISKRKFLILFAAAILSLAFIIYVNVFKNNCEKIILSFYEYIHNAGFKRSWLLHSLNNGLSKNFNLTLTNAMFKFFSVVVIAALGITIIKRYKDRKNYIFIIFFVVLLIELLPLNKLLLNMSLRKFNDMLIHKRLFEQISNDNENFRVHSVFSCGYSQHITFNQQDILGRTATMYDDYQTFLGSFGLRALELMNVKYIFANKDWFLDIYNNTNTYLYYTDIETGNRLLIPKNYKPRIYGINEIIFAENKKDELLKISQNINNHNYDIAVLPSNYKNDFSNLIFNPENLKIQNVKVNFNSIYFEAAAQTEQFVILSELFYDDWHCYINGKKMPIYRANYVFRSLKLPPGKNSVILKYKPYYFFYFCIISFTVLFILIIYLIKNNIRKQK